MEKAKDRYVLKHIKQSFGAAFLMPIFVQRARHQHIHTLRVDLHCM
nr:MAG TPA: hypothetical protein [Caudoviricetes sp.]